MHLLYRLDNSKVILKEITWRLEWAWDDAGHYVNNTAYIISCTDRWLPASANSPLTWWYAWRTAIHGKDEALRFIREYVEALPVATPTDTIRSQAAEMVDQLVRAKKKVAATCSLLAGWYAAELGILKPTTILVEPTGLACDEFIEQIRKARGARKPLSAAAVHAVREEYVKTVQPMQARFRDAERLERRLSDLVNEAYGLSPEEVRLMWRTAPPRMPLAEHVEPSVDTEDEAAEQVSPQGCREGAHA